MKIYIRWIILCLVISIICAVTVFAADNIKGIFIKQTVTVKAREPEKFEYILPRSSRIMPYYDNDTGKKGFKNFDTGEVYFQE
jgi:uncharacterized membrane protein